MDLVLDHVVLAVADLDAATGVYAKLLARMPSWRGEHPALGTRNTLFRLENGYLELLAPAPAGGPLAELITASLRGREERAFALALGVRDLDAAVALLRARGVEVGDAAPGLGRDLTSGRERTWRSAFVDPTSVRGVRLLLIEHTSPADALPPSAVTDDVASADAIDHVVLFTEDLEASLELWTGRFALAVRWRQDFPARGTRNAGLALGGTILELITRSDRAPAGRDDVFWGVAYRTADCAGCGRASARGGNRGGRGARRSPAGHARQQRALAEDRVAADRGGAHAGGRAWLTARRRQWRIVGVPPCPDRVGWRVTPCTDHRSRFSQRSCCSAAPARRPRARARTSSSSSSTT